MEEDNTLTNQDQGMTPDAAPAPLDHYKAKGSMPEKAPETLKEEPKEKPEEATEEKLKEETGIPPSEESQIPPDEVEEHGEETLAANANAVEVEEKKNTEDNEETNLGEDSSENEESI